MLILSRKTNETIVIDGRIRVKVIRVDGDTVKLGIDAPQDVPVHREEIYQEIQKSNQAALVNGRAPLPKIHGSNKKAEEQDTAQIPANSL